MYSDIEYDIPYTKVITFEQNNIEESDFETNTDYQQALVDDLKRQAMKYLDENKFPQINYKLLAHLENITDVGDTIYVKHDRCKIDLITNVISVRYDVINRKYKTIEFGNFKKRIKQLNDRFQEASRRRRKEWVGTSHNKITTRTRGSNIEIVRIFR